MHKDPIVEEVRKYRQQWAAKFNYDLDAMFADLKRSEAAARTRGVKFVSPRKRKSALVVK